MDYRFDAIRGLSLSDPLIDKNPNDRELLIARGKALSRNGLLAEAESSFRNALKLRETPQLREDLGDLIAQQPNRTKEAVDNYAAILAANPRRFDLQIKIGDLKANSRDGARLAIDHYKKALQLSKNLPRAHAGLSKAYAWLGESDLALYHASLAEKSGYANPKEMASLTNNLMEGREPEIGLEAQLDEKHRSDLFSSRISSGMIAKAHAGYFVDLYSRFGYEYLSSQFGDFSGLRGQGAYIGLQGEFRPSADITVMGGGGLTSLAAGYDPYEFNFSVQLKWQDHKMEFGVLKQLNSDSVTAIQPTTERSTQFGGIRNEIYLLSHQWEEGNLSSKNTMQRAMIQSINGKENQSSEFNCEGEFRFW
ncbi:MAG: hypothetical protein NTV34_06690, partial [Proteobacteria bacterium]|nr:hypothetical protein [Pseudomonadota bacterium]